MRFRIVVVLSINSNILDMEDAGLLISRLNTSFVARFVCDMDDVLNGGGN